MLDKIKSYFSTEKHQTGLVYAWIFFLCFLSYGILIPTLGFYWDDLPILFQYQTFGAAGFPEFLASDRPFSAWNFMLTTSLFHFNPLGYHILAFVLRLLSVILFYQIFRSVWPEKIRTAAVAASIFAIYPGFHQQPIALIYCHHFSVFCLFLLSVWLMVKNAQRERFNWFWGVIAWLATLGMFSIENFATLEMVRPLLLWFIYWPKHRNIKDTLRDVFKAWLPFLAVFGAFMFWRVFIFKFPTYEPDLLEGYTASPTSTLSALLARVPRDFFTVTAGAWLKSFHIPSVSEFGTTATYLFWGLFALALLVSLLVTALLPKDRITPAGSARRHYWEFLVTAVLLYFLAASIVWVLDMPLEIEFAWDRMTLAFIPSVALLAALLYGLSNKSVVVANIFFCLLIAAAVGSHFENEMSYKRDWEDMQDLFWQMSWRIPSLESGTTVMGSTLGVDYYSDNSLTAPLNLMYAPENHSHDLPYVFYYSNVRLGNHFSSFDKGISIHQRYRSFVFEGSTDQVIAVKYNPPACLQVMDRVYANSVVLPNLTEMQVNELKLTDLSMIDAELAHQPFSEIFGSQPPSDWCYYFEKADLARQLGDYQTAASLGEEAIRSGFAPRAASEWLPFLESNIRLGKWDRVDFIASEIRKAKGNYANGLCATLKRLSKDQAVAGTDKLVEYMQKENCL